jgi:hypothetical protein
MNRDLLKKIQARSDRGSGWRKDMGISKSDYEAVEDFLMYFAEMFASHPISDEQMLRALARQRRVLERMERMGRPMPSATDGPEVDAWIEDYLEACKDEDHSFMFGSDSDTRKNLKGRRPGRARRDIDDCLEVVIADCLALMLLRQYRA